MKFTPTMDWLLRAASRFNIRLFRMSGGLIGGSLLGMPVLLLTTVGRRSGQPRTVPLLYLREGDAFIVVASKGGSDEPPLWFTNLVSNPEATVEVRRDKHSARARVASDEERERLWPKVVALYGGYRGYQKKTERKIPLVILEAR